MQTIQPVRLCGKTVLAEDQLLYHAFEHDFFDLADGAGGVEMFGANVYAVHDGMAAEQAVGIVEVVQTFVGDGIASVSDEAVGSLDRKSVV